MQTPLMSEMKEIAKKRDLGEKQLKQILYNLAQKKEAYRIGDDYIHKSVVDSCRDKLIAELKNREQGISIGEFRDLVGANRKIAILLLTQYDSELLTKRVGELRVLVKK